MVEDGFMLDVGQGYGDVATHRSSASRLAHSVAGPPRAARTGKSCLMSPFQASASVTFVKVTLDRASHMAGPGVKGRRDSTT